MTEPFDRPSRIAINRVWTGRGDDGTTRLVGGQRVSKSDARIEAYGTVDELNAFVGVALCSVEGAAGDGAAGAALLRSLRRVQHELFNLGSLLATLPEDLHARQPRVREEEIERLQREMDACTAELEPLRSFVLPGGSRANADLHVCRTVCRRAERAVAALAASTELDPAALRYLNRLGDAFFVWSRHVSRLAGAPEVTWDPNAADLEGGGGNADQPRAASEPEPR